MNARACLGTLFLVACSSRANAPPAPRLVILYATCSLNKSFLAPYDPSVEFTPNLAAFARESVVFQRHTTESGQSGTDFAALLSGTQAYEHGVYHHPATLPESLQLVHETFAQAGYETHFWNGHPMASIALGYGQGVASEHAYDVRGARKRSILTDADPQFRALLDELARDGEKRAFVFANFTVTHSPYQKQLEPAALEGFLARFPARSRGVTAAELERWLPFYEEHRLALQWDHRAAVARLGLGPHELERLAAVLEVTYAACVAQLDLQFGALLAALRARGMEDETLLAFTADHGELLWRENALFQWTHGLELVPEVLDVPWIVRLPGLAPASYAGVTRSIDVHPTLAGLCGIALSGAPLEGIDLAPVLRSASAPPELLAYSHTTTLSAEHLESFRGLELVTRLFPRTDPALIWTRVRKGDLVAKALSRDGELFALEVFDLARDPGEAHDLRDMSSREQAELEAGLERYKARLVEGFERRTGDDLSAEERLERLRALGYVR